MIVMGVGVVLGVGFLLMGPMLFLGWSMHDPVFEEQRLHLKRGYELSKEQRWEDARSEFQVALDLRDDVEGVLGLALCTDHVGDYQGALALYDRAIRVNPEWYQPYMERAECIERNEGPAAVAAWYAELEQRDQDAVKYRYLLGHHHMERGRPSEALVHLHAALDAVMQRQRVTFTDDDQLAPLARIAEMEQNDLADLWPDVTYIAQCYLKTGRSDEAYRWATRGVSLHQHLNRCQSYNSSAQIEAGDTQCRLLRARIHMDREEWGAAERELAHARTFDDGSSERRCANFARELAQRRGQ